jgi:hypothetical protein
MPQFMSQRREAHISTQQRPNISLTWLTKIPNQTPGESLSIWSIFPLAIVM